MPSAIESYVALMRQEPEPDRIDALVEEFLTGYGHQTAAKRIELANAYLVAAGKDWKHKRILGLGQAG